MKILITGFEPFNGESVNPAYEAIKLLPDMIDGAEIIKLEIPTTFKNSVRSLEEAVLEHRPDIVLSVGQAGGCACVMIERVAINLADARIPDNDGQQPADELLQPDGADAYFATVPVKAMMENIRSHGIPCHISYTAGTYVCNCVMYNALYMAQKKRFDFRAGFIHVPYAHEQAVNKSSETASMSLEMIAKSLEYAVAAAIHTNR